MKTILLFIFMGLTQLSYAQAPAPAQLSFFQTCIDQLQAEMNRVKKVMIKDFNLKIRQKDILIYGPYQVGDQYFKVDYILFTPNPSKVTAEFELYYDEENEEDRCSGVRFHDYVY